MAEAHGRPASEMGFQKIYGAMRMSVPSYSRLKGICGAEKSWKIDLILLRCRYSMKMKMELIVYADQAYVSPRRQASLYRQKDISHGMQESIINDTAELISSNALLVSLHDEISRAWKSHCIYSPPLHEHTWMAGGVAYDGFRIDDAASPREIGQ